MKARDPRMPEDKKEPETFMKKFLWAESFGNEHAP
jgi:hypothetical protein